VTQIPKSYKAYYSLGWIVWFIIRWSFFIGLFFLFFRLGGLPGATLWERLQNLRPPRIQIIFPDATLPLPPPSPDVNIDYYTVVVASALSKERADIITGQLREVRIKSDILIVNGQYVITVGRFLNMTDANTTLQKVQKHGFPNARIQGSRTS
jgi:hypothetical protein